MKIELQKSKLNGHVQIPSSKSQTLRALLFALLAEGECKISGALLSGDVPHLLNVLSAYGKEVIEKEGTLHISGTKKQSIERPLYVGNSGIMLRFLSALSALDEQPVRIEGDESLTRQRPMHDLVQGLRSWGAQVSYKGQNHFAPITIQGPLRSGRAFLQGDDSQPVSSLLIAGAIGHGPFELVVENPGETPWVNLTLDWLRRFGAVIEQEGFHRYLLPGFTKIKGFSYQVPGDFSTAAFPVLAALVTKSKISISNLHWQDPQGDRAFFSAIEQMGARLVRLEEGLTVEESELEGIDIDVNEMIDALPALAVLGCFARGTTRLYNGHVARSKECDRIHCMAIELQKMGGHVEELEDGLIIRPALLSGCHLNAYHDHRLAMALAVAALGAQGKSTIDSASVVKTYPNFVHDLKCLGAHVWIT